MKYYCKICGITFESDEPNPVCPVCGATGDDLEVVEEDNKTEEK